MQWTRVVLSLRLLDGSRVCFMTEVSSIEYDLDGGYGGATVDWAYTTRSTGQTITQISSHINEALSAFKLPVELPV